MLTRSSDPAQMAIAMLRQHNYMAGVNGPVTYNECGCGAICVPIIIQRRLARAAIYATRRDTITANRRQQHAVHALAIAHRRKMYYDDNADAINATRRARKARAADAAVAAALAGIGILAAAPIMPAPVPVPAPIMPAPVPVPAPIMPAPVPALPRLATVALHLQTIAVAGAAASNTPLQCMLCFASTTADGQDRLCGDAVRFLKACGHVLCRDCVHTLLPADIYKCPVCAMNLDLAIDV